MAKKMKNASLNFGHQVLRRKESHATDTPPSRRDDYASRRGERRASRRKGPLTPAILGYKCAAKMERRGWRLTPNPTRLAMSLCVTARPPGGKRRGFRVCFWHLAEVHVFAGQCLLLRRSGLHLAASAPPRRSLATWTRRASSADNAPRQKLRVSCRNCYDYICSDL